MTQWDMFVLSLHNPGVVPGLVLLAMIPLGIIAACFYCYAESHPTPRKRFVTRTRRS